MDDSGDAATRSNDANDTATGDSTDGASNSDDANVRGDSRSFRRVSCQPSQSTGVPTHCCRWLQPARRLRQSPTLTPRRRPKVSYALISPKLYAPQALLNILGVDTCRAVQASGLPRSRLRSTTCAAECVLGDAQEHSCLTRLCASSVDVFVSPSRMLALCRHPVRFLAIR